MPTICHRVSQKQFTNQKSFSCYGFRKTKQLDNFIKVKLYNCACIKVLEHEMKLAIIKKRSTITRIESCFLKVYDSPNIKSMLKYCQGQSGINRGIKTNVLLVMFGKLTCVTLTNYFSLGSRLIVRIRVCSKTKIRCTTKPKLMQPWN